MSLKHRLDRLYQTFDVSMLSPDPLEIVRQFHHPEDREVAGLIASSLAYGRAEKIVETVDRVVSLMHHRPYAFTMDFEAHRDAGPFRSFTYRFTRGPDLVCLLLMIQQALQSYGSLQNLFLSGYRTDDPNIRSALTHFVETLLDLGRPSLYASGVIPPEAGVRYLLPSPRAGSACKRLNLYLRWMIRRGDTLDLGVWENIPPAKLIVPLDTHVARISREMLLSTRAQPDWIMAEEVTAALRTFDPDDPVKYDFALCHLGMLRSRGGKISKSTNQQIKPGESANRQIGKSKS